MIACLVILSSCGNNSSKKDGETGILDSMFSSNDSPKCDDPQVTETVLSILNENTLSLRIDTLDVEKTKIINIMTTSNDDKLKTCGCEGTIESTSQKGTVSYVAQKNANDEVIVKVDDANFEF